MKALHFLLLLWLAIASTVTAAAQHFSLEGAEINPTPHALYLRDDTHRLSIKDIIQTPDASFQSPGDEEMLNFGYNDAVYWVKLHLTNDSRDPVNKLVEVSYAVLDHVAFFLVDNGVPKDFYYSGDNRQFWRRPYPHQTFVFPVLLQPGQQTELYVKVSSSSSVQIPMTIWSPEAFHRDKQNEALLFGIVFGVLIAMFCYNLFVFASVRERHHLYYSLYVLAIGLFFLSIYGFGYRFLWPNAVSWNDNSLVFFLGGFLFFAGLYIYEFLSIEETHYLKFATHIYLALSVFVILASLSAPYFVAIKLALVSGAMAIVLATWAGVARVVEGDISARYFCAGFIFIVAGGLLLLGNKLGLLPRNGFTENALLFGTSIQVILLSLAMADRLSREKQHRIMVQQELLASERDLIESQQLALHNERKANEAHRNSLIMQQQSNEILEQKVKKRTEELEHAYEQMKDLASKDALTGVKNRKHLDEVFYAECKRAQRNREQLSVIMVDLDHFKNINDEFGHVLGDKCLIAVARQIKKSLGRATDVIARYGGEEFCILLPMTPQKDAEDIAETLRRNIEGMVCDFNGIKITMTVSAGVASTTPATVADAFQLIDKADKALYQAKQKGRNRVSVWLNEDTASA